MLPVRELIAETDRLLASLPEDKVRSVHDFVVFLSYQAVENLSKSLATTETETEAEFRADLAAIVQHSRAYDFLHDEPDLYTEADLIERYK